MTSGRLTAVAVDQFAADVREHLQRQPRQLPSQYFYDALGSALFDAICQLPWYPLTRAEARLLAREAHGIVPADCRTLVELGPGNGSKMASLLARVESHHPPLTAHLIDVSDAALADASRTLSRFSNVRVVAHHAAYEAGLAAFSASRDSGRALALFLGSNIGNFAAPDARDFILRIRAALRAGDGLLIGADLTKSEDRLLLAYDDPLGITAAFNRNILVRINAELGGILALDGFGHRAVWNPIHSRVEMHLVSLGPQRIVIPAAGLDFSMADGETIWTESSYKYEPDQIGALLEEGGFSVVHQWIDDADRFALTYAAAV